MTDFSRIGTNTGHGHAWARPDGVKMRCGGPGLCQQCGTDAAVVAMTRASLETPVLAPAVHATISAAARLEAAEAWRAAEQARINAVHAYNAKLNSDRERGEFPPRVAPEYRAMEDARRWADEKLAGLFLVLSGGPPVEERQICARGEDCVCQDPSPSRCNAFMDANRLPPATGQIDR